MLWLFGGALLRRAGFAPLFGAIFGVIIVVCWDGDSDLPLRWVQFTINGCWCWEIFGGEGILPLCPTIELFSGALGRVGQSVRFF